MWCILCLIVCFSNFSCITLANRKEKNDNLVHHESTLPLYLMSQFLSDLNLPNMVLFTLLDQTVHNQQLSLYYYLTVGHGSQRVVGGSPGLLEIGGPERQNCLQANSTDSSFLLCCSCINGPGAIVGKTVGAPNDTNNH